MTLWHWTELSRLGGASGGIASKIFKGIETLTAADLLAREVIQNSWDASKKLNLNRKGKSKVPFRMEFRFVQISGKEKEAFIKSAAISEIQEQMKHMKKSDQNAAAETLKKIFSKDPITLLFCEDFGAHGLYGHINLKSDSILFRAIYMFGDTGKNDETGTGGSYGFGKSAFIRGSGIQTVFAYSSFAPFEGDKTTRRLVGATYWNSHRSSDKKDYEGRAILGDPKAKEPGIPFEDQRADEKAIELGFKKRDASAEEHLGTSLLLIAPQVTPAALLESIEKWWWPAIVDGDMDISVIVEGKKNYPQPKKNNFVKPFLRTYEIATGRSKPSTVEQESEISTGWQAVHGVQLGRCALRVASEEELANEEFENSRYPQIALLRTPKMIIEYKSFDRRRVAARGVFIASEEADNYLKDTEPAQHSNWDKKPSAEIPKKSTDIAEGVHNRLSSGLRKFIEEVSPQAPSDRETLSIFSDLLKGLMTGKKVGPSPAPDPQKMPIELQFTMPPKAQIFKDQIFTETKFKVGLSSHAKADSYKVKVFVDFRISEDESENGEIWPGHITAISRGSEAVIVEQNLAEGVLKKGKSIEFHFKSNTYDMNWTSRIKPRVEIIEEKKVNDKDEIGDL